MSDIAGVIERARASVAAGQTDPSKAAGSSQERLDLQRVAQQFEAMLLTQMLREMRKAGDWVKDGEEGEAGLGLGTESFTETIDAELGMHLARSKGLGLSDSLMQAFDRLNASAGVHAPQTVAAPDGNVAARDANVAGRDFSPATITSAFGWRNDPFTGQAKFHKGIDLRAAYGDDVPAAAPGRVVFSGAQGGYGTTVVIEHADGSRSRYAHLSATDVEVGTDVQAGQRVGRAGRSGRATGTHLHFEVTGPDGQPTSPSQWMQRWASVTEA